jgi:putative transcription factor
MFQHTPCCFVIGDFMEECEICGRQTDVVYVVEIEGAEMHVCESCAKGKKIIEKIDEKPEAVHHASMSKPSEEEELVDDYGASIRKARERLGIPLKVLAERLNEKESMLLRVEEQKMLPSDSLVKKLEKELGIKLMSAPKPDTPNIHLGKDAPITIGDAASRKEQKK